MAEKRYFWLKLKEAYFDNPKIKMLRKIAGGDTYTIIYLKMQLLSIRNEGILKYEGIDSTFADEIALKTDEDVENVRVVLSYLEKQSLIEFNETQDEMLLCEANDSIGSECESAERVRAFRKNKKEKEMLQSNESVTTPLISNISTFNSNISNKDNIDILFDKVWKAYPNKTGKKYAKQCFIKLKPTEELVERMIKAIEEQKNTEKWRKDHGQYIPNPSTWLNQGRWEDVPMGANRYGTADEIEAENLKEIERMERLVNGTGK
jgi:predicted phage replisome organizer